ncbi:hypothetical protein CDIK_3373 [Cucumispora dikerogammari]|nr:hypothetical protein CDIK_3373 [Cucumispora dikerogammari]
MLTARKIVAKLKNTEKIKKKGRKTSWILTKRISNKIEDIVSLSPSLTLKEISKLIETKPQGFSILISSIDRALSNLKITKKKTYRELDRVNMPDKIVARKEYFFWFNNNFGLIIQK